MGRAEFFPLPAAPFRNPPPRVYGDVFTGTPTETPEAEPFWCPVDGLYDLMWQDDRFWPPAMLDGKRLEAFFTFEGDRMMEFFPENRGLNRQETPGCGLLPLSRMGNAELFRIFRPSPRRQRDQKQCVQHCPALQKRL